MMARRGRKPKHPIEKFVKRTHTFPPRIYEQFRKYCGARPASEILTSLIIRAMDMDADVLALQIQIDEAEADISAVKYKAGRYRVDKENLQTTLLSLKARRDFLMQEERYRELVEQRRRASIEAIRKVWEPKLKKWWDYDPPPLSEIRK